ncbi:MAG TPA: amino acid deaminase/aldolase [Jatrophihabitans sp.]|nr:amino acid deaminase/aldolase [Jatrophihabitans sp.]
MSARTFIGRRTEPLARLAAATSELDPPLAALDLPALWRNADALVRRAGGTPIRIAAKSVRCRWVLQNTLSRPGFSGVMAYSLAEAIWLARAGTTDILLGYPTADRGALRELAGDRLLLEQITLMVDDQAQLDYVKREVGRPVRPIRLCLDVDASLRIGRLHLGVRRSPVRTPAQAAALAESIGETTEFSLVGVMFYEAQIAGLPDSSPAVGWVKRRSAAELGDRRGAVVQALRAVGAQLEFVNSGGTGSLEISAADPTVTEVTAGSGLYHPSLFDGYRSYTGEPALFFALPVVRRPAGEVATLFGGGYPASGPAGRSRLPVPAAAGLAVLRTEGAGEVQTPVRGRSAARLQIGDAVWFRHAKAGEMLERFDQVHLVADGVLTDTVPSYRGEGRNFG